MSTYSYRIVTSIGNAAGAVEAKTKAAAEKSLREQYLTEFTDTDGNKSKVELVSLELEKNDA